MTIKAKIFVAILSANLLLALSMYLVSSWTFQHGFLDYVNRSELNQLEGLSTKLIEIHARDGNWKSLQRNRRKWRTLIHENVRQPVVSRDGALLRPSPDSGFYDDALRARERIFLLDDEKNILLGFSRTNTPLIFKPLYHEKKLLGFLAIEKKIQLSDHLDKVFAEQQKSIFGWIALGSIFISLLIAFPFASQIIKPIQALLRSTQQLTKGFYQTRVEIFSKDEIGKLAIAFNEMADNIEQHQKTQQQWIADISHELRTPLAVLKGEIEAMLDGIRPIDKNSVRSLQQEINYLSRLVGDLHELSKADSNTLSYFKQGIQISPIIEELIENFTNELDEKKLTVQLSADKVPDVFADKDRLTQLFVNLIQNNCRYCSIGANIHITIKKQDAMLEILWEDSGPGVSSHNIEKLFDRLFREDSSRSGTIKGSGLGLSISKSIVDAHKGHISAYHTEAKGLGIRILLPFATN